MARRAAQASGPERSSASPRETLSLTVITQASLTKLDAATYIDSLAMSFIVLIALLAAAGQETPAAADDIDTRTLTVTITDEKGAPLGGLVPEDVAITENGVVRELLGFVPDERPLTVALLLDTSELMRTSYRLHVLEPVIGFLSGLPADSQFAVWTVGERPTKRVDWTDDVRSANQALTRVIPAGGSTLLDALMEATKDLRTKEGERSAVVVVSAVGPEFSGTYKERVAAAAPSPDTTFHAILMEEGATDMENRQNYDYVLRELTKRTGGVFETSLSSLGLKNELQRVLGGLKGQYRLTYATGQEKKQPKLEVTVARPGAKVRVPVVPAKKS
jgi:VWFA-related protein